MTCTPACRDGRRGLRALAEVVVDGAGATMGVEEVEVVWKGRAGVLEAILVELEEKAGMCLSFGGMEGFKSRGGAPVLFEEAELDGAVGSSSSILTSILTLVSAGSRVPGSRPFEVAVAA